VRLLLDTHALLWWLADDPLSDEATGCIADPGNAVAVSAASAWEISVKSALGKLRFEGSIVDHVEASGFDPLPVSLRHAERAGALPLHHRDPFDRMLVAQAQAEGMVLVTRDVAFGAYDVELLAC
jgi:PIN domain nuclease of toxin-antitoxin system